MGYERGYTRKPDMEQLTRSQEAFSKASTEVKLLIKSILHDERSVQHQKRRALPSTGEGIHEAILRHVKETVK
jgi:hypothetical protein